MNTETHTVIPVTRAWLYQAWRDMVKLNEEHRAILDRAEGTLASSIETDVNKDDVIGLLDALYEYDTTRYSERIAWERAVQMAKSIGYKPIRSGNELHFSPPDEPTENDKFIASRISRFLTAYRKDGDSA